MNTLDKKWQDLNLQKKTIEILQQKLGLQKVMPVQDAVIPLFTKNYDVAVQSCTGSGKTLAFLIPLIEKALICDGIKNCFGLIIAPTRELAIQIFDILKIFCDNCDFTCSLLIGGIKSENINSNFLVGTLGRIKELIVEDKLIETKHLEYLVLDEADRLIEYDQKFDLKNIISALPKQRRTGLFSATLSGIKMKELMKQGLRNPVKVELKTQKTQYDMPKNLTNYYQIFDTRLKKFLFLISFLKKNKMKKIIVFFNTCKCVDFYSLLIERYLSLQILKIHGKFKQNQRTKRFIKFQKQDLGLLITTDVLARGADFDNVDWIIQFDPPQNQDFFVHRVGRTARGIHTGKALLLLNEEKYLDYLQEENIQFEILQDNINITDQQEKDQVVKIKKIMLMDKMNFIIATSAFISYVQSYKEMTLKKIFDANLLNYIDITKSFFLPRIPYIKENKRIIENRILDQEYYDKYQETDFKDENQKKQFEAKEEKKQQQIQKNIEKRKNEQKRIKYLQNKKKKRSYQDRKKAKERILDNEIEEFNEEERMAKKLKKGKITQKQFDDFLNRMEKKYEYQLNQLQWIYTKLIKKQIQQFKKCNNN